ncbi:MAG: hypothetical protein P4M01_04485 [Acidobacteriota bacterium]|nr:hypothetical protein [Acidobacteriota bacterium]
MTNELTKYFQLPDSLFTVSSEQDAASPRGFFTFGDGVTLYGRCRQVSPGPEGTLPDALSFASGCEGVVRLPFDFDEVVHDMRWEEYVPASSERMLRGSVRMAYYMLRPFMSVRIRKYLQRIYLSGWQRVTFPHWPVERSVDTLMERTLALGMKSIGASSVPFIWFWPEGHQSCAIVTHDVETTAGRDFCSTLMDIDESCGMKSSFQVVPEERYTVPEEYLESIRQRGFEVNVHDLNHDGMLYRNEETFRQRVVEINRYGKEFRARGFRAGVMYRNQRWFHLLDFEYDMSVPSVAHLEPQRGGCCTNLPYFMDNLVELPLTTTQDYALFHLVNSRSMKIWETQIAALHQHHALISVLTHPDYLMEPWSRELYLRLLRHIAEFAKNDGMWLALPGAVNDWWRYRNGLKLKADGQGWRIEGDAEGRARIAYAILDGDGIRYSLEAPQDALPELQGGGHGR